jgi:2'-5' RNA ligase
MHRLFIAIQPPAAIRQLLLAIMGGIDKACWQEDSQLHLTLRFIGEVDRHRAADIANALGHLVFAPLSVTLSGVGQFDKKGRVNAVWAGAIPREPLERLHRKVDRLCVAQGLAAERRAYLPHVTLARLGNRAGPPDAFLLQHATLRMPSFTVDSIGLYESILGNDGPAYHLVDRYPARIIGP